MIRVNEENEEKFSFDKYILSSYQGSTVLIEAIKLVNFSALFISNLPIVLRVRVILSVRGICMHVVIVKSIKSIRLTDRSFVRTNGGHKSLRKIEIFKSDPLDHSELL